MREWKELRRFQALKHSARSIVFYAEDAASLVYFEPLIKELTQGRGRDICYLTSSPNDPLLRARNDKVRAFYIGSGAARIYLFLSLKADVLIMTMPDLQTFHIKRSKVYPVHYVYVFHSIVSTHLNYRQGAFDRFDTILCVGPHHLKEIRATEAAYGLKAKNLLEHGYARLDRLLEENAYRKQQLPAERQGKKRILVAPSWGVHGLLETRGLEITKVLLEAGYQVIVRPHPVTRRKWPRVIKVLEDKFRGNPDFVLESDIRSQESLHKSDCMISDWSGVALEYAFALERPVLFVDVPKKVNNPNFKDVSCQPLEVAIREEIGTIVPLEQIDKIPEKIEALFWDKADFQERIRKIRSRTVFNIGRSAEVGAGYIVQIADKCKNQVNK